MLLPGHRSASGEHAAGGGAGYAFTVPTLRGWRGVAARLEEWFENAWITLRGDPCPGYVHDLDLIEERLATAGFRLRRRDRYRLWHIAVYERFAV